MSQTPDCHLIYISHGPQAYAREAAYSILSVLRYAVLPMSIHVVTDHPDSIKALLGDAPGVHYLPLSAEQKVAFVGDTGYVHRLKPQAIAWATRQVARPEDTVLFLDTDTAVLADLTPLIDAARAGQVVLNECEGPANAIRQATSSQRRSGAFFRGGTLTVNGQVMALDPDTPLWNSGVIVFEARRVGWFDETVAWIDAIWPRMSIHTVEQIAFSAVLHAHHVPLRSSEDLVFHYHWFKEFRHDLEAFFEHLGPDASWQERVAQWPAISPEQRVLPKRVFLQKPKWQRSLLKRLGHDWKPAPYPWQVPAGS